MRHPAADIVQPCSFHAEEDMAAQSSVDIDKPKAKRKRGVEKMEADLVEWRAALVKKKAAVSSALGRPTLDKKQKEKLEKDQVAACTLEERIATKSQELVVARRAAVAKAALTEQKEKAKAISAAADAHMSEAGAAALLMFVVHCYSPVCSLYAHWCSPTTMCTHSYSLPLTAHRCHLTSLAHLSRHSLLPRRSLELAAHLTLSLTRVLTVCSLLLADDYLYSLLLSATHRYSVHLTRCSPHSPLTCTSPLTSLCHSPHSPFNCSSLLTGCSPRT